MRIAVACNNETMDRGISLESSIVSYARVNSTGTLTFNSSSRSGCATKFTEPIFPDSPRDPPPGNANQTFEISRQFGSEFVELNLKNVQAYANMTILGTDEDFYKTQIRFSPYELIGCHSNCEIYGDDYANVLGGVGDTYNGFYRVGNRRFGLNMEFLEASGDHPGINVTYLGGAADSRGGNYARLELHFHCDADVAAGELRDAEIGQETCVTLHDHERIISLDALSQDVCARKILPTATSEHAGSDVPPGASSGSDDGNMKAGTIAAITVSSVAGVAIVAISLVLLCRTCRSDHLTNNEDFMYTDVPVKQSLNHT